MRTAFPLLVITVLAVAGLSSLVLEPPDEPLPDHFLDYANPPFERAQGNAGLDSGGPLMSIAAADMDRDGWSDIAVSTGLDVHLYRNRGDGGFERQPDLATAMSDDPGRHQIRGLAWIDANRDRWPDLYLSSVGDGGEQARVLINDGGTLRADSLPSHIRGNGWSVLPWDFDGNGVQDRLSLSDRRHAMVLNGEAGRGGDWQRLPATSATVLPRRKGFWPVALYGSEGAGLRQLTVNSKGRVGVTADSHLTLPIAEDGNARPLIRGLALGDVNGDGHEDLFLSGGIDPPIGARQRHDMVFFRFDRSGGMRVRASGEVRILTWSNHAETRRIMAGGEEIARSRLVFDWDRNELKQSIPRLAEPGVHVSRSGDELLLVVVVEKEGGVVNGRILSAGSMTRLLATSPAIEEPMQQPCGSLFFGTDDGFAPAPEGSIDDCGDAADAAFGDFDNDGDLDLFVLKAGWPLIRPQSTLYRNDGSGVFSLWDVPGLPNAAADTQASVLPMDVDKDGRLDLVMASGRAPVDGNLGEGATLWRNQHQGGNWLAIELTPDTGDPFALGATVTVHAPGLRQIRRIHGGDTPRSSSLLPLHFGLGDANKAMVTVDWVSGQSRRMEVRANRRVRISESPQDLDAS